MRSIWDEHLKILRKMLEEYEKGTKFDKYYAETLKKDVLDKKIPLYEDFAYWLRFQCRWYIQIEYLPTVESWTYKVFGLYGDFYLKSKITYPEYDRALFMAVCDVLKHKIR